MSAVQLTTDSAHVSVDDWQELAGREGDGLEILLLWSKTADRVKVTVSDSRLDESFELDIASAEALAAFHHPFAYAADRGLGFGDVLPRVQPTCRRRAEKETAMSPAEAFEEPRGPRGSLERDPLEDRPDRLARVRRRRDVLRQPGRRRPDQPEQTRTSASPAPPIASSTTPGSRSTRKARARPHERDRARPVQDPDRRRSCLPGSGRRRPAHARAVPEGAQPARPPLDGPHTGQISKDGHAVMIQYTPAGHVRGGRSSTSTRSAPPSRRSTPGMRASPWSRSECRPTRRSTPRSRADSARSV